MIETFSEIYRLLPPNMRLHYQGLLGLFIFGAILQVAGVASLAPFIALLSNHQMIHDNPALFWVYQHAPVDSETGFLIFVALAIIVLLALTNAVAALTTWAMLAFSMQLGANISRDVYRGYLYQDYVLFSRANTSELIANITQQTPLFIYMVVQPSLQLISQMMIVVVVALVLLYINPFLALSALAVVGVGYGAVYGVLKRQLASHGENAWRLANLQKRLLNESLGGIKEVKVVGAEQLYDRMINDIHRRSLHSSTMIALAGDLPKFMLETIAFSAMLVLAIYLLSTNVEPARIVAILSLYGMAGYKVLPAAQTIFKSASSIKANRSVIATLSPAVQAGRSIAGQPVRTPAPTGKLVGDIVLTDVSYSYPGTTEPALRNIDATLPANKITAIVGESGAGKSTLLDLLLGLLPPSSGEVTAGGTQITQVNLNQWQAQIGYVAQHIYLTDDSMLSNISFGNPASSDRQLAMNAAVMAKIDTLVESLPGGLDFVVGERGAMLSGGQRQRIGIARALYRQPSLLVMDEATSALDSVTERDIMNTVADLTAKATVVLVAHRVSTIRYADHVILLESGVVADSGSFEALYARNARFREMMAASEVDLPA
jgi:HlyD family secretion protein